MPALTIGRSDRTRTQGASVDGGRGPCWGSGAAAATANPSAVEPNRTAGATSRTWEDVESMMSPPPRARLAVCSTETWPVA
jgi:hypothetical protein